MSALVSRLEHATIVEGERLGTVHIVEATCSRLRFFVRNMNTDMCTYTYMYIYMCVYVCVFVFASLVGWLGVVWCGVLWSWFPCPWSFVLCMMSVLQRARAERSMIERRVGQCMERVVLAPFSK